jgi:hypothetical protein
MQHLIRFCVYAGGQRPFEMIASQWSAIDWQQKTPGHCRCIEKQTGAPDPAD